MIDLFLLSLALLIGGYLAFSRTLARSRAWRATLIPLASIMGSGFLVSAPLLAGAVGNDAVFCMAGLLAIAYGVGAAIRFNIRHFEPIETISRGAPQSIALVSRLVLSAAYFVSVTYYLQLLAAFALNAVGSHSPLLANVLTSGLILVVTVIGMWRGLAILEGVEKYAVSLNLGMIGALLVALAVFNANLALQGKWALPDVSSEIDITDLRVLLGLLIVVQGFETSRYIGDEHPPEQRIATMRAAQLSSAAIYLVFIGLATVLFRPGLGADVTAIIGMTRPVAAILPILLSVAAIGSQFSAAVADTSGAGGLIEDLTRRKLPMRYAYLLVSMVTIFLTWETDVNAIIAYASRAFALYYMLQCLVAVLVARQVVDGRQQLRQVGFSLLAVVCFLVFMLGLPSE